MKARESTSWQKSNFPTTPKTSLQSIQVFSTTTKNLFILLYIFPEMTELFELKLYIRISPKQIRNTENFSSESCDLFGNWKQRLKMVAGILEV